MFVLTVHNHQFSWVGIKLLLLQYIVLPYYESSPELKILLRGNLKFHVPDVIKLYFLTYLFLQGKMMINGGGEEMCDDDKSLYKKFYLRNCYEICEKKI